jgi:ssDNA-binding Zn-finger/Zn-ribbon topoisomerase 1
MNIIDQIESQIRKLREKIEVDKIADRSHVAVGCPKCGKIVSVHRMRARYGFTKCPECGTDFVVEMVRT